MSGEPSYPDDAPVGDPGRPPGPADAPPEEGERAEGNPPAEGKRTRRIVTGAAIGIGSAALVAALLYANRSRKGGDG